MSLTREWEQRIRCWIDELPRQFYEELGPVELEGFCTFERLRPEEAARRNFEPMPVGRAWGAKWEYGWFRGSLRLPAQAAGRRVVLRLNPGKEGLVFANGAALGARDREHTELCLCRDGRPGASYDILAEFYAGHGPIEENVGPVPPGRIPLPEPGPAQRVVEPSSFGLWDEDAFGLWVDALTLYQARSVLPEPSLRAAEIDEGLRGFCRLADFELPREGRDLSFRAARAALAPLLERRNGPTAPTLHVFGQSHLDLAWQWPREETLRKAARTVSSQLALMEEYPEYRFLWCQVPLFLMLKEGYPELYARLKEALRRGQLIAEGGMWLEPDTNLPSGESLVRQAIRAKRFFAEELGADTRVLWLPDTFGFSAALPQIMRQCGLDYFATKKLADGYGDGDPFPYNVFEWQGIDGSRVLSHLYRKCNSPLDPQTLARRWERDRVQKDGISAYLVPFGYGDGGGGPTREMLEFSRRLSDLEGLPRTRMSGPREFFEELERSGGARPAYVGELYFTEHRGTYTSQARLKRAGRKAELALRDAELWSAAAGRLAGRPYPREALEGAWTGLLMSHFHDVVTGVGIRRVVEEAEAELAASRAAAEAERDGALRAIAGAPSAGEALLVSNSLSWPRTELVELPEGAASCSDAEGRPLPVQSLGGRTWALAELPSCGWASLLPSAEPPSGPAPRAGGAMAGAGEGGCRAWLENELLRVELDARGGVSRLYDKQSRREIAAGSCNELRMYRDVNANYDAWDIGSMYAELPVALDEEAELRVLEAGPLAARVAVGRDLAHSRLEQIVSLRAGSRRLDFETRIDWREDHKLLKVAFEANVHADEALSEIQFGYVARPNHRSRKHDADRFEACHHRWVALVEPRRGFAVLNDCKYGASAQGRRLELTLLKSAFVPDMRADRGPQEFTYSIYAWNGSFADSGLVRRGYELNCPPVALPMPAAAAGPPVSAFSIDDPAVILEAAKLAEDGSGDLVLRLYESLGSAARCALSIGLPAAGAAETDLLEAPRGALELREGRVELDFRPFEIKTLRLGRP
ncbi:MAG TPA: glycoside hydrolase family 38 C-terminal domain-containing protein [Spirochaetia bacterium]|nr:glycoside hydrolase family 38 C-terminal domain-containing protein [Spirochaetia bacterium]HRZ63395.1 glycoside hydrolase family 38 C-terminal domain-containing protein [Spirochaetia bacterium]